MSTKTSLLTGKYKLVSHGTFDYNKLFTPTSPFLKGELFYSSENTVTVLILFAEFPDSIKDILSYVGTFKIINSEQIEHHITLSSHSRLNETIELRNYVLDQNTLKLGKELPDGRKFEAVWIQSIG